MHPAAKSLTGEDYQCKQTIAFIYLLHRSYFKITFLCVTYNFLFAFLVASVVGEKNNLGFFSIKKFKEKNTYYEKNVFLLFFQHLCFLVINNNLPLSFIFRCILLLCQHILMLYALLIVYSSKCTSLYELGIIGNFII